MAITALGPARPVYAAAYVVTTLADETATNGLCSLREAIAEANNTQLYPDCGPRSSAADTISFNVSGTISLSSPLPTILAGVGGLAINGGDQVTLSGDTDGDGDGDVQIFSVDAGATLSLERLSLVMGAAANGGAIYNSGNLTLSRVRFADNSVSYGSGGAIYNSASLSLSECNFSSNRASYGSGGAIYNKAALIIYGSSFDANHADGNGSNGGAIYSLGGSLAVSYSRFTNNSTSGEGASGGAIFEIGTIASVRYSSFFDNIASHGGGAIFDNGSLMVENCLFNSNHALAGGAVEVDGHMEAINSTFSENTARAIGGAIFGGETLIYNSTILFNTAESDQAGAGTGGGIYAYAGYFLIKNTIVAGNTTWQQAGAWIQVMDDCYGSLVNAGYNLMQSYNASYCSFSGGAPMLADPLLGPLQSNGSLTWNYAPLPGSPAIDGGDPNGCKDASLAILGLDQRGFTRPVDGDHNGSAVCDIGAVEYGFRQWLAWVGR